MHKINFIPPLVFEILKFQKSLWACVAMPDHTQLNLHDQFITLIDMKLHAKNQLCTSNNFWDINVEKSCNLIGREHFCIYFENQIFPKHAEIMVIIMAYDLNPRNLQYFYTIFFCKIQKTLVLGCFWVLSLKRDFFQKSDSVTFLPLRHPNFMRSFRKILRAVMEKTCLTTDILTYWPWWNHRTPFHLKSGVQKLHIHRTEPLIKIL